MVKIRLTRTGRRNHAQWRIGAFDSRMRRDGRPIEYLGWYDPHKETADQKASVNKERVQYWLGKGAQPTSTVARLLKGAGVEL